MSDARTYVLRSAADVSRVVDTIRRLELGPGRRPFDVTIAAHEEGISDSQRRLLYALCGEISDAGVTFPGGGRASGKDWKEFLVGLCRGERMARDGNVVVVLDTSISGATRSEASDLIAFIEAWGVGHGVHFRARDGDE